MTTVNTKLPLLRLGLELNTLTSYKRHAWDYAKANVNGINKAISQFKWQGSFTNLPVHEQVNFFNSTLMNIFSNFITNKIVTFNGQDPLGSAKR